MIKRDIPLKTVVEIAHMKKPAKVVETMLSSLASRIIPGVTTAELDHYCAVVMKKSGVKSVIEGYRDFPGTICTSVNNVAVHGLPNAYRLKEGDLISVDIAVSYEGWCSDSAWTYSVGKPREESLRLLQATWQSLIRGIAYARAGNRLGDIGAAVADTAEQYDCSVLWDFVGHGIGRSLHEEPRVLNFGEPKTGMKIVPGMVFTIEPILTLGKPGTKKTENGWSFITEDGAKCAQFEQTVAVFENRTELLTFSQHNIRKHIDFPPFF
jgi:methionyl aminopeptidase